MPQKLTVSDYTFYFVRNAEGKYRFKEERGNVHRLQHGEFQAMIRKVPERERRLIIEMWGISNVRSVETGENTLVYSIFKDLVPKEERNDCCRD